MWIWLAMVTSMLCIANGAALECQTSVGAEALFYRACALDVICAEYNMIPRGTLRGSDDDYMKLLSQPSATSLLFQAHRLNILLDASIGGLSALDVHMDSYVSVWDIETTSVIPRVYYNVSSHNGGVDCLALATQLNSLPHEILFPLTSAVYTFNVYKMVIADEQRCHDINERLVVDRETGIAHCSCIENMVCGKNTTEKTYAIIFFIAIVAAFPVVIAIIVPLTSLLTSQLRAHGASHVKS